jgi:DNA-binding LytR/AlgR family response regulator
MNYTCYIVDDEPLAIKVIEQHLAKFPHLEVVGSSTDPVKALAYIKELQPDLLFIDIQMPELTGLEFIESIQNQPSVVITTAYREFAVEAFDLNALDYLVKPISFKRFVKTIDKFLEQQQPAVPNETEETGSSSIFVRSDRKMVKVNLNEIRYVEGVKDYVKIILTSSRVLTKLSVGNFLELLPEDRFMRVHKSFIVPLPMISAYSAQGIEIGGVEIPIGRAYKAAFLERMEGKG